MVTASRPMLQPEAFNKMTEYQQYVQAVKGIIWKGRLNNVRKEMEQLTWKIGDLTKKEGSPAVAPSQKSAALVDLNAELRRELADLQMQVLQGDMFQLGSNIEEATPSNNTTVRKARIDEIRAMLGERGCREGQA